MPSKTGPPPVGRPARLSREKILDAAMSLLEKQRTDFSLRKLARHLDTVPGNLYTYFASREALFDALAERVLATLDEQYDAHAQWDAEILYWMDSLREAFKSQPVLLLIIGMAGTAPTAVRKIDFVARLLREQGLAAESAVLQAQSLLWTVMSFTLFELQASEQKVVDQLKAAGAYEDFPEVLQHLALSDLEPLWRATTERTMLGLRGLLKQQRQGAKSELS